MDKPRNFPIFDKSKIEASVAKGIAAWRGPSKVGAPLGEPHLPLEALEAEALDLGSTDADAPMLSRACEALGKFIPEGMSLRGLGDRPGDKQAIYDHWIALGPDGLRTRFFITPNHALLRQRAFGLDFENPRFAGIFDADGTLACLAEWAHDGEGEAEAAFSTRPGHQRHGLAKIAAAACALDARESGIRLLRIDTLLENHAAQRLALSLGGARKAPLSGLSRGSVSSYIDLSTEGEGSIESRMGLPSLAHGARAVDGLAA